MNSDYVHQLTEGSCKNTSVMMVIISYDFLKKIYPDIDQVSFQIDYSAENIDRIRDIYEEFRQYSLHPHPLDYIKLNGYLYEIVYFLLSRCVVENQTEDKKMNHTRKKVLNYIEAHYREDITLKMISEAFGMSESHFSRKFHQFFGISFKHYVDRYRIYQAFNDIIRSSKSMQQIAMEHGFPNIKSFIAHFKKEYGITPYQYRKNYFQTQNSKK